MGSHQAIENTWDIEMGLAISFIFCSSMVSGGPWSRAICPSLYELTKLDDDTFDQKLRDGTIHPDMQRKDAGRRPVENLAPIRRTGSRGVSAPSPSAAPAIPKILTRAGKLR